MSNLPSARLLRPSLCAVAALVAFAGAPLSAQEPERSHTVVRGNTLWDLAASVYGDPFRWPVIYDANRDRVQDPDLIYPGQVLRIPQADGTVTEVVVAAGEPGAAARPAAPATGQPTAAAPGGGMPGTVNVTGREAPERMERQEPARMLPVVSDDQVAAAPFLLVSEGASTELGRVAGFAGAEEVRAPRSSARLYDRMIIEMTTPVRTGTSLQAYRPGEMIPGVGRVAHPTGLLEVEPDVTGAMVARVRVQYDALRPGDLLRPVPSAGLEGGVEPREVSDGPRALLVAMADDHALYTVGDHAFLDVGRGATVVGDEWVAVWPTTGEGTWEGRLQVVAVQEGFATVRIANLVNPVFEPGITVQLHRRMPGR